MLRIARRCLVSVVVVGALAVPAAQAHKARYDAPFTKVCQTALRHHYRLASGSQTALAAACRQLKADLQAAEQKYKATVGPLRDQLAQAYAAVKGACQGGQGDSQACQDARASFDQLKHRLAPELRSASQQLYADVKAAVTAFKAAVAALNGGGDQSGKEDNGYGHGPSGPGDIGRKCGYLVTHAPADKQAALQSACGQLAAAVSTAQATFRSSVQGLRDQVNQALAAVRAACENGHGDSQACQDARTALQQAKSNAYSAFAAAQAKLQSDLRQAVATFRAALQSIFGNPQESGEPTPH